MLSLLPAPQVVKTLNTKTVKSEYSTCILKLTHFQALYSKKLNPKCMTIFKADVH